MFPIVVFWSCFNINRCRLVHNIDNTSCFPLFPDKGTFNSQTHWMCLQLNSPMALIRLWGECWCTKAIAFLSPFWSMKKPPVSINNYTLIISGSLLGLRFAILIYRKFLKPINIVYHYPSIDVFVWISIQFSCSSLYIQHNYIY